MAEQGQGFCPDLGLHQEWPPFPSPHCSLSSCEDTWLCLGRRGRETWEGWTLLTSPNGSSQVSGPNPSSQIPRRSKR